MYIVFEGIDKVGKSTLFSSVTEELLKTCEGRSFSFIKEPVREIPVELKNDTSKIGRKRQVLYYAFDRLENYDKFGKAYTGEIVLMSDRSKFSSYAYQGKDVMRYNQLINYNVPNPDILIYLYTNMENIVDLFNPLDSYEKAGYLKEVHENYMGPIKNICEDNYIEFKSFDTRDKECKRDIVDLLTDRIMEERT